MKKSEILNIEVMNASEKLKFIQQMHSIKLMGGRKRTYKEVLIREVEKGNPKAIEIYNILKDKLKERE